MLKIETELKQAFRNGISIGLGIFTKYAVNQGEEVYEDSVEFSKIFDAKEIDALPAYKVQWLKKYATYNQESNNWYLSLDDARFWNHDENPNCKYVDKSKMVAVRRIEAGEELTSDYREFCDYCKNVDFGFEILN